MGKKIYAILLPKYIWACDYGKPYRKLLGRNVVDIPIKTYGVKQFSYFRPCPEVMKKNSCSTQLSSKFILLINVKMPTIVGILTLISMINATAEFESKNSLNCLVF